MNRRSKLALLLAAGLLFVAGIAIWRYYSEKYSEPASSAPAAAEKTQQTPPPGAAASPDKPPATPAAAPKAAQVPVIEREFIHPAAWDLKEQGKFLYSVLCDHEGNVWAGTEDSGLWCFSQTERCWMQYTTAQGLGEDTVFALACDCQGRVWAGHGRRGVSVFNGVQWKTYGPGDGPLGERVTGLAVSPLDGDVWLATNAGLTRYRAAADDWQHLTRAEGLPVLSVRRLAFASNGDLYAAGDCEGLAMARAAENYTVWSRAAGPDLAPPERTGSGMPSNCLNDVLVAADGAVWAATAGGLAVSSDHGRTWKYWCGKNWHAKTQPPSPVAAKLLSEDFITCLARNPAGGIVAGHRHSGLEMVSLDPAAGNGLKVTPVGSGPDYVRALLPLPDGTLLAAGYGRGLWSGPVLFPAGGKLRVGATAPAPLPREAAAVPVSSGELLAAENKLRACGADPEEAPCVVALEDDWTTRGDWLGRYGRYWACLPATYDGESEYLWGAGEKEIQHDASFSCNCPFGLFTDNPGALELPAPYVEREVARRQTTWKQRRRENEWNDWVEKPVWERDGPHLYFHLRIPQGVFVLSLYSHNKDGRSGQGIWDNRIRDCRISIRAWAHGNPPGGRPGSFAGEGVAWFEQQPELARGRIADFWSGVYKRFVVRGPLDLAVQVNKNYSYMTTVAGIFLDDLDPQPPPYFGTEEEFEKRQTARLTEARGYFKGGGSAPSPGEMDARTVEAAAADLSAHLEYLRAAAPGRWARVSREYASLLLRYVQQHPAPGSRVWPAVNGRCLERLGRLEEWEQRQRAEGLVPARAIEQSLRWDGVSAGVGAGTFTDALSGQGRRWVQSYVRAHRGQPDFGVPTWLKDGGGGARPVATPSAPREARKLETAAPGDF